MSRATALVLGGVLLLLVAASFAQSYRFKVEQADLSYRNRLALATQTRAGCERSKLDRGDNAAGWRTAQAARLAAARREPPDQARYELRAAARYDRIARGLEQRQRVDCRAAYPLPSRP